MENVITKNKIAVRHRNMEKPKQLGQYASIEEASQAKTDQMNKLLSKVDLSILMDRK